MIDWLTDWGWGDQLLCVVITPNIYPFRHASPPTHLNTDRLGIQKMTARIDNTDTPTWDALLDFGCVEKDSRISFRCVLLGVVQLACC